MARIRLGELLVDEELITGDELEEALKAQMIYGGRLGTNLIELGYIDDETLAYVLSEKLGLPYAHPGTLAEIDPKVISIVPKETAEKYKVVPVQVSKRRISVVMADPEDVDVIKDLSFMTGYIVQPMVTPELRLWQALEKHYGIKQEKRYIALDRNIGVRKPQEAKPAEDADFYNRNDIDLQKQDEQSTQPEDARKKVEPEDDEHDDAYMAGLKEKIERLKRKKAEMIKNKASGKPPKSEEDSGEISVSPSTKTALETISSASGRDELVQALLDYAVKRFPRALVLIVKDDIVIGLKGYGEGLDDSIARKVRIPLTVPSVFKEVGECRELFFSKLPPDPMNKLFEGIAGIKPIDDVLITAIFYKDTVVSFLACIGEPTVSKKKLALDMEAASKRASSVFEKLIEGGGA